MYVEFALEIPAHFTVMFDVSLLDVGDARYQDERRIAFAVLYEAIRRATRVRDDDELQALTLAAWLAVHGIATLWLSGNLPIRSEIPSLVAGAFAEIAPALAKIAQVGARQARRLHVPAGT